MEDATWLAAELDADIAACRVAIDRKRRQAADRGNPWRNVAHMVRNVIPLDEWRIEAQERKPAPRAKPVIVGDCGDTAPHDKHVVETDQHRVVCWGPL